MTGTRLPYLTGEFCASLQGSCFSRLFTAKIITCVFCYFSEGIVFFLDGSCYKNDLKEFRFT